ncbi:MAG: CYTH domain-containing protein [Novosphingobium sp.]|nr:CYTH domain-containing protein [Novosphingobium sp.]
MAREIERKFLVRGDGWRARAGDGRRLEQAYLAITDAANVRVRIIDGSKAFITVKSARSGMSRDEFEYAVPVEDARAMMTLRKGAIIEKTRHEVPSAGALVWEVDVFAGAHEGLVLCEIELPDEATRIEMPDWLGAEVTGDPAYYNAALALT